MAILLRSPPTVGRRASACRRNRRTLAPVKTRSAPGNLIRMPDTELAFEVVPVDQPADTNVIIGQAHFIKTVDDLHEALAGVSPHLRFGIAFCEASGARLVRHSGNDAGLVDAATGIARSLATGHAFVVLLREGFPVNVLNQIKAVPEVCGIFCAT